MGPGEESNEVHARQRDRGSVAQLMLLGVIAISLVCAGLLAFMNSVTQRFDRLFVVLCFLSFVVTLLNQSLFSSVWSGGAFFLMLFLLLHRSDAGSSNAAPPQPAVT